MKSKRKAWQALKYAPRFVSGLALKCVRQPTDSTSGQALIESCIVIAMACLLFMGLFQISQLFAAHEILDYAATRGARAKAVGFNQFMVFKTVRVGAIPNAGRLMWPVVTGGPAAQYAVERTRIPLYLGSERWGYLSLILNYSNWPSIHFSDPESEGEMLRFTVSQDYPLAIPMHRAFFAADSVTLAGESYMDSHYSLYLDDRGW